MDSTPKTLKAVLEAIRDMAANALNQIRLPQAEHSMRWKCKDCQYVKRFTRPVVLETAGRCPRCKIRSLDRFCEISSLFASHRRAGFFKMTP